MSDVPKIVVDRLRAATPAGSHPDADVLTAFAEHVLSGAERETVVRHLAACGDCREIVALSIPPVEGVAQPEAAAEPISARRTRGPRAWFAWPKLRWAAVAAAVIVTASVVYLRPAKEPESTVATVSRPAEKPSSLADTTAKLVAPPRATQAASATIGGGITPDSPLQGGKTSLRMNETPLARAQAQPEALDRLYAGNKRGDAFEYKQRLSLEADQKSAKLPATAAAAAAPTPATKGEMAVSEHVASSSETVEVTGAAPMVEAPPTEDRLMTRVEPVPPIQKAKPPAKEEAQLKAQAETDVAQKKLAGNYSASSQLVGMQKTRSKQSKDFAAQWSLSQGKLQRSVDAGATWQVVLQLEHPLLAFGARGSDVWAGGQAGTLLHSSDSGATWSMVQPSTKAEPLTSDIVAIEIRGPVDIVLTTSLNQFWTTSDSGKTWEKK